MNPAWDWLALLILLWATRFISYFVAVLALFYAVSLFNNAICDRQLERSVYKKKA